MTNGLLQLLLGAEVGRVSAALLAAVDGAGRKASIAVTADHLVAVVLLGKLAERGLDDTTAKAEHEVEGALLLDVVVRKGAAVLELLASEDEALLIRGDALLVLDLSLDVLNAVAGLNLEGDRLAGEGLDEDLHAVVGCVS